jgi:hypothetical protein
VLPAQIRQIPEGAKRLPLARWLDQADAGAAVAILQSP